ncbi:YtxH domain-containing protein [Flavihumibacter rivuli]|uniref:YtxH domain-containing protein n=1 Tax=Flavihumibacter rivuli TaxID=2838156 RepID=UPI001BDF5952|nr:YtxH domain-containing protein [Flavihumibacter rivuli]ULQ58231.1 YtxH domain-containing protein [Flavihumibacter rivuli]
MTNTNKMLTALAAGIAIGGVLGLLFAPDKGENTRKKISDGKKKLTDSINKSLHEGREKLSNLRSGMRESVPQMKEPADEFGT